jgi:tRNA (guanine37-N1)-methyltransferase
MQIALVSLFPEMFAAVSAGRAVSEGAVTLSYSNPRDYTEDRHRTVDDRPYGGGPGMLMKIDPLRQAIAAGHLSLTTGTTFRPRQGRGYGQRASVDPGGRSL